MILALLLACAGGAPSPSTAPPPSAPAATAPAATPTAVAAPNGGWGLGRAPTAEEIAAWDIDVDASGASLPPGRGTVADGATLYTQRCAACHGVNGEGGLGPQLWGAGTAADVDFSTDPKLPRTIGNWWPYATTIFDYVRRAMPQTQPGSLTDDETYALVAFLLHKNELLAADAAIDGPGVKAVKMPAKDRFVPDDRKPGPDGFR